MPRATLRQKVERPSFAVKIFIRRTARGGAREGLDMGVGRWSGGGRVFLRLTLLLCMECVIHS